MWNSLSINLAKTKDSYKAHVWKRCRVTATLTCCWRGTFFEGDLAIPHKRISPTEISKQVPTTRAGAVTAAASGNHPNTYQRSIRHMNYCILACEVMVHLYKSVRSHAGLYGRPEACVWHAVDATMAEVTIASVAAGERGPRCPAQTGRSVCERKRGDSAKQRKWQHTLGREAILLVCHTHTHTHC